MDFSYMTMDLSLHNIMPSIKRSFENPSDSLFTDFRDCIVKLGGHNVFETIKSFEQLCEDQVDFLQQIIKRRNPEKLNFDRAIKVLRLIQAERSTWRLINAVFEDRLVKQPRKVVDPDQLTAEHTKYLSDSEIFDLLFNIDDEFRLLQLVINWCEQNAADMLYNDSRLDFITDKTVQWENTLKRLSDKNPPSGIKNVSVKLDPDAVTRESLRIDDQDAEDENHLLRVCFTHIRAGQLSKAVDLCAYCGQSWRAATLRGGLLFHDPNINVQESEILAHVIGNKNREIWKKMCWMLCNNAVCPNVEKAIYGSLSGHLDTSLLACKSWEDCLWAFCKASAENLFDNRLRNLTNGDERRFSQPNFQATNRNELNLEEIFGALEASEKEQVKQESLDPFHVIQKYLILNQPHTTVRFMHAHISEDININRHILRFMAHVVLIFGLCGLDFQKYFANGILEAYIALLIEEKRIPLIAAYVSYLPEELQINSYAKCLENLEDPKERRYGLDLAEEAGLNLRLICIRVVQRIRESTDFADPTLSFVGDDFGEIVAAFNSNDALNEDLHKLIYSIEWLLFEKSHRGDAVIEANAIARKLLVAQNLRAVKDLLALMPADTMTMARSIWFNETGDDIDIVHQNHLREYLCIIAYLEANEAFAEWFEHFYRRKPADIDKNVTQTELQSFDERAAQEYRLKEYEANLQRWKKILDICTERATKSLYNVLLFPDGGWLRDVENGDQRIDDDDRQTCMSILRRRCIPLVANMLLTILKELNRFQEALQLADLIVANERQLYKEFPKEYLRIFLSNLKECSVESLNNGFDFLGFSASATNSSLS